MHIVLYGQTAMYISPMPCALLFALHKQEGKSISPVWLVVYLPTKKASITLSMLPGKKKKRKRSPTGNIYHIKYETLPAGKQEHFFILKRWTGGREGMLGVHMQMHNDL